MKANLFSRIAPTAACWAATATLTLSLGMALHAAPVDEGPDTGGTTAAASAGCGKGCCGRRGAGGGPNADTGAAHGHGAPHHDNIQALLDQHTKVDREVRDIEGGVETLTTSEDPEVTATLREHVQQMKQRMEYGQGLRWWDPLFVELFQHHDKVRMEVEEVPGGVLVRETSDDPQVTALIRQHAVRGVSEFVSQGRPRASQPTPLPEGYTATADAGEAGGCPMARSGGD